MLYTDYSISCGANIAQDYHTVINYDRNNYNSNNANNSNDDS